MFSQNATSPESSGAEFDEPGSASISGNAEINNIFVGSLPWELTDADLAEEFSECGPVASTRIVRDRMTGRSRGFGYVTFATKEGFQKALELKGLKIIDGRSVNIDVAESMGTREANFTKRPNTARNPPSSTLFIGNLAWTTTTEDLQSAFEQFGEIHGARIITLPDGQSKGFGYVEFSNVDDAVSAFENFGDQTIAGRNPRLDYAAPRAQNGEPRRGGFRGRERAARDDGMSRGGRNDSW